MSSVLSLSGAGGPAIDARPLIGVGLVPPALGRLSDFEREVLVNGLENDQIYGEVLHLWTGELDRLADDFAADLGVDAVSVRDAFVATLREWEAALGQLVGCDLELSVSAADVTVLAPSTG